MSENKIHIEGPGGCFSYELAVICKALVDAGVSFTLYDEHPKEAEQYISDPDFIEHEKERMARLGYKRKISITTEHFPWGG